MPSQITVSTTKVFSKWRMLLHFFVSRRSIPGRHKRGHTVLKICSVVKPELFATVLFNRHYESSAGYPQVIPSIYVLLGNFVASLLELKNQSKDGNDREITRASLPPPQVCGCVYGTTSESHSRKLLGFPHTHCQAVRGGSKMHKDSKASVRKTLFGCDCICCTRFTPSHQSWLWCIVKKVMLP